MRIESKNKVGGPGYNEKQVKNQLADYNKIIKIMEDFGVREDELKKKSID
jgi:hypothetical protein